MEQQNLEDVNNLEIEAVGESLVDRIFGFLSKKPVVVQFMRFVALGVLNTAVDFILFNFLSKSLGISQGWQLGYANVLGFSVAVIQSYLWNRAWVFGADLLVLREEVKKMVLVGLLGGFSMVAILISAKFMAVPIVYLVILSVFIVAQLFIWYHFGLKILTGDANNSKQFTIFVLVSIIGLLINSLLVSLVSSFILDKGYLIDNPDLVKNLAKILATFVSLIWNFFGYKLLVFRR
jgi:putative flippase GtrA